MNEVTPILRAQEADDLEDLFENAPCGYASALPNGRLSRVNQTLAAWTGYTAEQLVGRRFLDLLNIAGKIYYETHFAPLLRMQGFFNEVALDIVRSDGAALPVLVNAVARRDEAGELRFIRITVFNASDRRRYERDLLKARRTADQASVALQNLNLTLEAQVAERTAQRDRAWRLSQELLVVALPDGTFESVNPTWTELLGWRDDELIGASFVERTHPDDLEAAEAALTAILTRPLKVPHESRFRRADGSYRWFAWTAAFEDGRIYASGRDITLEREQADALRQSQKMEAVGQLTGGLAHDFNNLLAGISGSLEMMQNRMQQGRFNDVERYMAVAQGASKRAAALTHRLLAFSRRQTLDPKPTDVNRLVAGMHEMIQRTVGPGILVEVVGAAGLWPALVDPPQLENALLNLCINARDAMPDGGRITVETANKWLDERASRKLDMPEGQYLSLCVTDTGIGMSKDVIARVFEPFFTTKPIGEGTGLGLSMIYGFAQQSGGQVRIYSEVGEGSTVCIYLPRHYGEVAVDDPIAKLAVVPRSEQGETVLVVDDEPSVRMFTSAGTIIVLPRPVLDEMGGRPVELSVCRVDGGTGREILVVVDETVPAAQPRLAMTVLALKVPPQDQGQIRYPPRTLRQLDDILQPLGTDLLGEIKARALASVSPGDADERAQATAQLKAHVAVLVAVPMRKEGSSTTAGTDLRAFLTRSTLLDIARRFGWLDVDPKGGVGLLLFPTTPADADDELVSAEPQMAYDRELATLLSGREAVDARKVTLVGAGAVGSHVAANLAREGLFTWTVIDPDHYLPHNAARHVLYPQDRGLAKATATAAVLDAILGGGSGHVVADVMSPPEDKVDEVRAALTNCDLLLDASASVAVSRHLASSEVTDVRRISFFFNPAGTDAVLITEPEGRGATLRDLEAQYYAELLTNEALDGHLTAAVDQVSYSGACRQATNRMPEGRVATLSGLIATEVGAAANSPEGYVRVWRTGSRFQSVRFPATTWSRHDVGAWTVSLSDALAARLTDMRSAALPVETGGVLLGVADTERRSVRLCATLDAPPDSVGNETAFERGVAGLRDAVRAAARATGGQLAYAGEWHSHPPETGNCPSPTDLIQLGDLAAIQDANGIPGLMIIVGDEGLRLHAGELLATVFPIRADNTGRG